MSRPGTGDPRTPTWPWAAVAGWLAAVAAALVVQLLTHPAANARSAPAVLAVVTFVVGALVLRHSRGLDPQVAGIWRAFAAIAGLLGLGHLARAIAGVGVNPTAAGLSDLPLVATGPIAVLLCVRLVRSAGGRLRVQVVLDAAVALISLGLLLGLLVPLASGPGRDPLLTLGYPAISGVLVAAGLVTFSGVSAPRRPAAAWLLIAFASLAVTMASGAFAVGSPSAVLDAVTSTAYLAMVAAVTRALADDPGPRARTDEPTVGVPLAGIVVSYCLGSGVLLLLLGGLAAGRPIGPAEAVTVAVLTALTLLRTLVWVADGARLTRQVLRTEAYFRTLVHRSADLTVVLDARGQVTWASAGTSTASSWPVRDLEGRVLRDLVHDDDRYELHRALDPDAGGDDRDPVFRLIGRDGSWREFETVRTASSAGLPGGAGPGQRSRDGVVLHLRDVAGRRSTERELERLAYTDYLTGLPNRARLMAALAAARTRAAKGQPASFLLLDLDGFKPVNDIAGHEAGDHLLIQVAERLRATVRDGDLVGRLGGDEFAVLVDDGIEEATALAERIVADLRTVRPVADGGTAGAVAAGVVFEISGSIGVTELDPADDISTTIRRADLALRAAKGAGKSCVRTAGHAIDSALGRRTRLARDLAAAIELEQFRMVYQPVAGIEERRILGLEALVRWDHPVLGTVSPDEFIELAEADGLIVPLQQWVLRTATADFAGLLAEDRDLKLGINISVRHLQAGCLAPDVAQALAESGVPPNRLMIEVTESIMLDAEDRLQSDLATLREMGCIISLDDFGRGYSSLAYLARLPVDVLKMDREFIGQIETDPRGAVLVAAVVDLGRTLGMDVVAEGVETPGQLQALRSMQCRFVQGWLIGRPMAMADLPAFLDDFDPEVFSSGPLEMDTSVHVVGRAG
ncbi:putative bifunctional diguanylate cyclase/phosphodiesterase [Blastococcus haudaquaticus]|uniref:PAS domain S-box-containing protein/diguanylate cyclase (GGDEF) domain-containing protein n=1 Tax=Blastococcus haudaquaticus TaxID=1938745 RepID=A0A286GDA5_9ACTN|nr:GGDEF domain-containing protein [Blastococcus haudaquaticus]SOD93109.1 PAS domain S-box-containing protein/diguanylate cyclase (GGDEF) domain-containing protein [Blastococcus haudaquaticus]